MKTKTILPLIILIVLTLWILSGTLSPKISEEKVASKANIQTQKVLISSVYNQKISKSLTLQGSIAPIRQVDLISETTGKVKEVLVRQGQAVKKGDVLLTIDQDERSLKLEQAQNEYDLALLDNKGSETLVKQGALSQTTFKGTKANLSRAKANLEAAKLELSRTIVRAPFDGVIENNPPEVAQYIAMNTFMIRVIDINPIVAKTAVPQTEIQNINLETSTDIKLLSGQILKGKVHKIAPSVNENTRAFDVEVSIFRDENMLPPLGISATLMLKVAEKEAIKVSSSILSLDEQNRIIVKAINEQDEVYAIPIEIVRTDIDATWVAGIADKTRIITRGAGFVSIGEKVQAIQETNDLNTPSAIVGAIK